MSVNGYHTHLMYLQSSQAAATAAGQKRKRAEDQAAAAVGLKRPSLTPPPDGQAGPPDPTPAAAMPRAAVASDVSHF